MSEFPSSLPSQMGQPAVDTKSGDSQSSEPEKPQVRLADVEIDNEITALNIMVQFLGLAQKRGAYTIDEAAKIWECVKKFQRPQGTPPPTGP